MLGYRVHSFGVLTARNYQRNVLRVKGTTSMNVKRVLCTVSGKWVTLSATLSFHKLSHGAQMVAAYKEAFQHYIIHNYTQNFKHYIYSTSVHLPRKCRPTSNIFRCTFLKLLLQTFMYILPRAYSCRDRSATAGICDVRLVLAAVIDSFDSWRDNCSVNNAFRSMATQLAMRKLFD
jgi:hypothetical protein